MIHLMYHHTLGLAVMLLSAGGGHIVSSCCHNLPSITVSLREMTLVDKTKLTCTAPPHLQCSFYINNLPQSSVVTKIDQSDWCVLTLSGALLVGPSDKTTSFVRKAVTVSCMYIHSATKCNCSQYTTIGVWNINKPISYIAVGLTVVGFVILLSLALNCMACADFLFVKGNRNAVCTRSYEVQEHRTDEHDLHSAPKQWNKDEMKVAAEDDICYATVSYSGERPTHMVNFEQSTEYATVVIKTTDGD